jgi:hypothetical protein
MPVLAGSVFAVGILRFLGFRLFPPGFAGNDKSTARREFFSLPAPSAATTTLTTMGCHIFPIQHKNETIKRQFGS